MDVSSLSQALDSAENNSNALPRPPDPFRVHTIAAGERFLMPHKAGQWLQFQTMYACHASETLLFFRARENVDDSMDLPEIKWMTLETKRTMRLLVHADSAAIDGAYNPIHTDMLRKVLAEHAKGLHEKGTTPADVLKTIRSHLEFVEEDGRQFVVDDALPAALAASIRADAKRHFSEAAMLLEDPMENARKSDLEYGHEQALVALARLYQCDGFVMQHTRHDARALFGREASQVCFLPHANDGIDILVEPFDIMAHQKALTDHTDGVMALLGEAEKEIDGWFLDTNSGKITALLFGLDEIIQAHGRILGQMDNRVTRRPALSQFVDNKARRDEWKRLKSLADDYDASQNQTQLLRDLINGTGNFLNNIRQELKELMNGTGTFFTELVRELDVVPRDFLDA